MPQTGSGSRTMNISDPGLFPRLQPLKLCYSEEQRILPGAHSRCDANRIERIQERCAGEEMQRMRQTDYVIVGRRTVLLECHDDRKARRLKCGSGEVDLSSTHVSL
jgi:hypothetical protein